jgi:hypothetical protein
MADDEVDQQAKKFAMVDDQNVEVAHWRSYNGKGTASYTNGDKYEGGFLKGRRHGAGTLTYANGDLYDGHWENGAKSGIGKATYVNNGHYHGYFRDGKKAGNGLFMYKNKDRYSGDWKNGLKHGTGTYIIEESNIKMVGSWFEGKFLTGKMTMANGDVYEGEFYNNKPNGKGIWSLNNGNLVEGEYTQETMELGGKADPENPIDPLTGLKIALTWNTGCVSRA